MKINDHNQYGSFLISKWVVGGIEDFTTTTTQETTTVGSSRQILENGSFQLNIPGSKSSSFSSSAATQLLYIPTHNHHHWPGMWGAGSCPETLQICICVSFSSSPTETRMPLSAGPFDVLFIRRQEEEEVESEAEDILCQWHFNCSTPSSPCPHSGLLLLLLNRWAASSIGDLISILIYGTRTVGRWNEQGHTPWKEHHTGEGRMNVARGLLFSKVHSLMDEEDEVDGGLHLRTGLSKTTLSRKCERLSGFGVKIVQNEGDPLAMRNVWL